MDDRRERKDNDTPSAAPPAYDPNPLTQQTSIVMPGPISSWRRHLTWATLGLVLGVGIILPIMFIVPIITYARVPHDDSMVVARSLNERYLVTETVAASSDAAGEGITTLTETSTIERTTTIVATSEHDVLKTMTSTVPGGISNHFFTVTVTANVSNLPPAYSAWSLSQAGPPFKNTTQAHNSTFIAQSGPTQSGPTLNSGVPLTSPAVPHSTSTHLTSAPATSSSRASVTTTALSKTPSSPQVASPSPAASSGVPIAVSIVSAAFASSYTAPLAHASSMPPPPPPPPSTAIVSTHTVYSTTTPTTAKPAPPPATSTSVVIVHSGTTTAKLPPNTVVPTSMSSNIVKPTTGAHCDWTGCKPTKMDARTCRMVGGCAPQGDKSQCACLCDSGYCTNWHGLSCNELKCCINCKCVSDNAALQRANVGCWNAPPP